MTNEPSPIEKGRANLFYALEGLHLPLEERAQHYQSAQEQFAQQPGRYALQEGLSAAVPAVGATILGGILAKNVVRAIPAGMHVKTKGKLDYHVRQMDSILHPEISNTFLAQNDPKFPAYKKYLDQARAKIRNELGPKGARGMSPSFDPSKMLVQSDGYRLPKEMLDLHKDRPRLFADWKKHLRGATEAGSSRMWADNVAGTLKRVLKKSKIPLLLGVPLLAGAAQAAKSTRTLREDLESSPDDIRRKVLDTELARARSYRKPEIGQLIAPLLRTTSEEALADIEDEMAGMGV